MGPVASQTAIHSGRVCVGVISGAHGVRGEVKVKTFTADPAAVAAYGPVADESGARLFELSLSRATKGGVIARVAGVGDRDAAQALKGTKLYVDRDVLPEPARDEFYHADLIGLAVELRDGKAVGRVKAVHDFGAGDLLEIVLPDGRTELLPFTREAVPEVDIAGGRLVAEALPEKAGKAEREGAG
jgi:16S rRNA processing protein RimM